MKKVLVRNLQKRRFVLDMGTNKSMHIGFVLSGKLPEEIARAYPTLFEVIDDSDKKEVIEEPKVEEVIEEPKVEETLELTTPTMSIDASEQLERDTPESKELEEDKKMEEESAPAPKKRGRKPGPKKASKKKSAKKAE